MAKTNLETVMRIAESNSRLPEAEYEASLVRARHEREDREHREQVQTSMDLKGLRRALAEQGLLIVPARMVAGQTKPHEYVEKGFNRTGCAECSWAPEHPIHI